jgi:hypothetical protein
VGKTTLLAMLYREAVGGRLADLRLAAADARTANYLSEKILQLETGQALPATLAETELRFHLYQGDTRLELLVKDYQGEHIELDREEPIREFLKDCDAVWLCLDAAALTDAKARLRRQQEVERLIEDYLAAEPQRTMSRPVALILTKADLLRLDSSAGWAQAFDLVRHALQTHCPRSGLFAVSSLGPQGGGESAMLCPSGLAEPLGWLVEGLEAQDEARLEQLWAEASSDTALLVRSVACFSQRYPKAEVTARSHERLRALRWRKRRRHAILGMGAAACLLLAVTAYDALGYQRVQRFESEHPEAAAAMLAQWQRYRAWHPTRNWFWGSTRTEESHLVELAQSARQQARVERLADLRQRAVDPDTNAELVWQGYRQFHADYPEVSATELEGLRNAIKARRDAEVATQARRAFDAVVSAETTGTSLPLLISHVDRYLQDYPDSALEAEARRRRDAYLRRLDEQAIQEARDYSARSPLNFQTRCDHYQSYLDQHPGGAFAREAESALRTIAADWDKHDFRTIRDLFQADPSDIPDLVTRCRGYLTVHPNGRFKAEATDLLRWTERVTAPGEYRVVLRDGRFDPSVARLFSRGPKLSVELEVNGVRHGPSSIIRNRYDPEWNFEYPRRIRWKMGDPVRIWVTEHSWKDRVVMDLSSTDGEPFAMKLLSGEVWSGQNHVTFESDFTMPRLPSIE